MGGLLQKRRRRNRPNACDGGGLLILPLIVVSRSLPIWREAARTDAALALSRARFSRIVVVRVLYHCHQCVDAASGGIRDWDNGRVGSHEHSGAAVEP